MTPTSRRAFLKGTLAAGASLALPGRALFAAERTPDLLDLDALAAAELVRKGEISAVELVRSAIERVERLAPTIHAVVTPLPRPCNRARSEGAQGRALWRRASRYQGPE